MRDSKPKRKARKSKLLSTPEVLHSLLQNGKSPLANQFKRWKLWQNWSEVVGPSIGKHTLPVAYDKKVLYIWVKSSAMMQEFIFVREAVKDKINAFMGVEWIKGVHYTLDQHAVPQPEDANKSFREFIKKINK